MLVFKGIQKTTLIDFPNHIACTLFLPKCNFRCPFCYNPGLVFGKETGTSIPENEALAFLDERKGFLEGVCITGGEPLLHSSLPEFCKKVKAKGLLVKLDTNGSRPKALKKLIEGKLLDYIAMDIKAARESYDKAAGVKVDLNAIQESIDLIRKSGVEYEFRLTAVPALHSEKDLISVGAWLKGSSRFFLQQFNPKVPLLDKKLEGSRPFPADKLQGFAEKLKPFFEQVSVRGV